MKALGGSILSVRTNVSKQGDVEKLARRAFDAFGQVHLLFNNAGDAAGGPPWEAAWNDWEWVIGVNLWGVIYGVKVFTPLMLAQNTECHIVNTSSTAGLVAGGFPRPLRGDKARGGGPLGKPVTSLSNSGIRGSKFPFFVPDSCAPISPTPSG